MGTASDAKPFLLTTTLRFNQTRILSSSALISQPSLALMKPAVPNESNSFGLTSRRTTCKIPTTSSTSPPTKRWQRFSVLIESVPSVWPSSCPNTFHNFSNFHYTFRKHADNDAPRKTEKKNWTKIILGFKNDPYILSIKNSTYC